MFPTRAFVSKPIMIAFHLITILFFLSGASSTLASEVQQAQAEIAEVIVTGSRIHRDNFTSASPITVIEGATLVQSGFGDLGEALRRSVFAGSNGINQSSMLGGGGATSLDLRNIGTNRVLVLINGRRVASFADALANQLVDLTFIPNALVERVEILRDGASAIYGSDAISGVVNVILKEKYEGIKVGATRGLSGEGDAGYYAIDIATGTSTERGQIMVGGEYRKQDNLPQFDRDWAFPSISNLTSSGFANGSPFHPGGVFFGDGGALHCTVPKIMGGDEVTDVGFPGCPSFQRPTNPKQAALYDYGLEQDMYAGYEIMSFAGFGSYEFYEGVEGFVEAQYARRQSDWNLDGNPGSTGTPAIPGGWRVPASNPNNPTGQDGQFLIRPTSTIGVRRNQVESDTLRLVAGLRGTLDPSLPLLGDWFWEVSGLHSRVSADLRVNSFWNLARAVRISDPTLCAADPECASVVNVSGALDVFRPGNWTNAEIDYLRHHGQTQSEFHTTVWMGLLSGSVATLPAGELKVALGAEYRKEEGRSRPDAFTVAGESVSNQTFPTNGSFTINEYFAEIDIPLLRDQVLFQTLDLNAQFRHSDYSEFGSEQVFRLGLDWQMFDSLRLRGTFSTAFRAPTVTDLFGGGTVSFEFFTHPCSNQNGEGGNPDVATNCAALGIPLGTSQLSPQFPVLGGSNAALLPETADTATVGLVLSPTVLPGFSISLDYWEIRVKDLITNISADTLNDRCLFSANLSDPQCANFDNRLLAGFVVVSNGVNRLQNVNSIATDGFDLNMRYEFDGFGASQWQFELQGAYVDRNTLPPGLGSASDRGSIPRIRSQINTQVNWQNWTLNWQVRYIHSMRDPRFDGNNPFQYKKVPAQTEHDLRIGYSWKSRYRAVFGVNNLFDQDPPYVFSPNNNSDLFLYSPIGRSFFLRLTAEI